MKKILIPALLIAILALTGCSSQSTPANNVPAQVNTNNTIQQLPQKPAANTKSEVVPKEQSEDPALEEINGSKNNNGTLEPKLPRQKDELTFTLGEIAQHSDKEDCWLLIDGKVYDITDFIPYHPGKDAILEGCGKDATQLFETRPMGSNTPHSGRAREISDDYYIGELKQ